MDFNEELLNFIEKTEIELQETFRRISRITLFNQGKMLRVFQKNKVAVHHFQTTSGYGYNDLGRETLETVFADVFGTESALVRQQLVSGTHAISCALLGNLKVGDELLIASGYPYETLLGVLGIDEDAEVSYNENAGFTVRVIPLTADGAVDEAKLLAAINPKTKMIAFQRSCGYASRPSLKIADFERIFAAIKQQNPQVALFVDNCYGEFVEKCEPTEVGADLIAGSLIKNPGGCLVPCGGYIAGRADLVEKAAERLYAPKIGGELGPSLVNLQVFFQGFFEAPHRVGDMVKGAALAAALFGKLGYQVAPSADELRTDIIQKIRFDDADDLIAFCRAVQKNSPIESHVTPEPSLLPGYLHPVIMGGGTFISGATSEFSADAPIVAPFTAFMQGGLSYTQIKLGLIGILTANYSDKLRELFG